MCEAFLSAMDGVCVNMYITCGTGTQRCLLKSQVGDQTKDLCFFFCSPAYLHRFSHKSTHFPSVFLSLRGGC